MAALTSTALTYRGHPSIVSAVAQMLREEGLEVSYDPPLERRSVDPSVVADGVIVNLIVLGTVSALKAGVPRAVAKFRASRLSKAGTIEVDEGHDDNGGE